MLILLRRSCIMLILLHIMHVHVDTHNYSRSCIMLILLYCLLLASGDGKESPLLGILCENTCSIDSVFANSSLFHFECNVLLLVHTHHHHSNSVHTTS